MVNATTNELCRKSYRAILINILQVNFLEDQSQKKISKWLKVFWQLTFSSFLAIDSRSGRSIFNICFVQSKKNASVSKKTY